MVTKAVSDQFGKGGIADQMIRFNGFPFLDKEDHQFNESGKCGYAVYETTTLMRYNHSIARHEAECFGDTGCRAAHGRSRCANELQPACYAYNNSDARFTSSEYRGFPIVRSDQDSTLLGYITRADLTYSMSRFSGLRVLVSILKASLQTSCAKAGGGYRQIHDVSLPNRTMKAMVSVFQLKKRRMHTLT